MKVNEKDWPGLIVVFQRLELLVDVWLRLAVFVQRTVEPGLMVTVEGLKAKLTMLICAVVGVPGGQVGANVGVLVRVRVGVLVLIGVLVIVWIGVEVGGAATTWNWPIMLSSSCSNRWQWKTYKPV